MLRTVLLWSCWLPLAGCVALPPPDGGQNVPVDKYNFTLALGLRFFQGQYRVEWALLMAVSLIILAPTIVLFFVAQKNYIQGIVITGVKG